jgi:ferredoxin-thioredoxin reductase catalytic subunit
MEPSMKVNGVSIKQTERESFGMQMGMCTKVTGKMIKLTALECTFMLMEPSMKDSGRMTCRMAMVSNLGQTEVNTLEATRKA